MTGTAPTGSAPPPASPASAASPPASPARRVLAQAGFETRGLLSHGEQLVVSLVLPLMALVALALVPYPDLATGPWAGRERIDVLTPGVLALAVMSTAFTGQAILLAFERRWGVLRLLGTTPLGRGGLLLAKALSVLVVIAVQLLVLGGVAALLGWRPGPGGLLPAAVVVVLGAAAFALLAACLGGTLRAEAVLALANLVWVLLAAGGGVLLPVSSMPPAVAAVVVWLPSAALGDGLRAALVEGRLAVVPALVLLAWALVAGLVARRALRWSD
ncbi:ABC transporter permease [Ornithinimicrobium sp. W1679]|uniref:ABC transporter permease n=1 Tax=Ornithinimicrobium sp. W1679 TaxID=3418770 RepID=UPI003CF93D40